MPFVENHGARLYWRSDGHAGKPAVLFLNSLGTDFSMWDAVVPPLTGKFRVIRTDMRGHGASDAPPGPYSIPLFAQDALAVMDAAGVGKAHVWVKGGQARARFDFTKDFGLSNPWRVPNPRGNAIPGWLA